IHEQLLPADICPQVICHPDNCYPDNLKLFKCPFSCFPSLTYVIYIPLHFYVHYFTHMNEADVRGKKLSSTVNYTFHYIVLACLTKSLINETVNNFLYKNVVHC